MEKELVELFEAAKKAADGAAVDGAPKSGPKVDRCVDALKQLKSFPVNYDVLVSTQVAKRLRHLTKHPVEQIQTMASDVVEIWKKIVIDETLKKKNGGLDKSPSVKVETVKVEEIHKSGSIKVEKISKSGSFKIEKVDKGDFTNSGSVSRTETVKVAKKVGIMDDVKAEKVYVKDEKIPKVEKQASSMKKSSQEPNAPPKLTSLIKCGDGMRDKIRELLIEALSKVSSEADEDYKDDLNASDPFRVAVAVESAMFEKMGRSNGPQKVKYRSIMFNIKDPNNPDLRRKLLLGQVKPERLVNMSPEEMASDERQRENRQIKDKALFECERGAAPEATTDQFKCGRCQKRMCTYYQLQTRSADEPMTTFVTCVNCNNHWKFC
ncbi:transcription elongation factor TFIIS-like [Cornus florida]|uniref:transcription elongation factor TFIIS-like n=1 Tax=Cornus florida TaxID=4283 RepID=UPI0028A07C0A|nr:transcription elongation factor TFIIS-like [Cornus florida]